MDNVHEDQMIFSSLEMERLFSHPWECGANICLPLSSAEQAQSLFANPHSSPLPSPTIAEGFAVPTGHLPYGSLHNSNTATQVLDHSVASNTGTCQSQWSEMSSSLTHGTRAPVPQLHNQYQIPHELLCGWSRDFEPSSAPSGIQSNLQSLSMALSSSYPNTSHYDAWMSHVLDGTVAQDTCSSSPDGDTALSASGFFGALADYDFSFDACADSQPSIALTHKAMSSVQSATFPSSERIRGPERQTRVFGCRWLTNGAPCEVPVMADRRSVVEHLQRFHEIKPGEEKSRQMCLWDGCRTILNKESLARHILTVHLKEKAHCVECGLYFAREDSLKRHLKGGQHKVSCDKSAAKQPSRNHAGPR